MSAIVKLSSHVFYSATLKHSFKKSCISIYQWLSIADERWTWRSCCDKTLRILRRRRWNGRAIPDGRGFCSNILISSCPFPLRWEKKWWWSPLGSGCCVIMLLLYELLNPDHLRRDYTRSFLIRAKNKILEIKAVYTIIVLIKVYC